jgi:hypothetical protein
MVEKNEYQPLTKRKKMMSQLLNPKRKNLMKVAKSLGKNEKRFVLNKISFPIKIIFISSK